MDLRYPIGTFSYDQHRAQQLTMTWIEEINTLPRRLQAALTHLSEGQLDLSYRPGGWTVRQVVHHLADSHLNSYLRFKLALTEDQPVIKPYDEQLWATLPDNKLPVEVSIRLLEGLHQRWAFLLKTLNEEKLQRTFIHPDAGEMSIHYAIGMYAWHGNHHLSHIELLQKA